LPGSLALVGTTEQQLLAHVCDSNSTKVIQKRIELPVWQHLPARVGVSKLRLKKPLPTNCLLAPASDKRLDDDHWRTFTDRLGKCAPRESVDGVV
jgi:hypothetical protein